MSSVWETTYRLLGERLRERLAQLADRGPTPDCDDELLLRLLGSAVDLHEWHHVDRYGRCRRCRPRRRWWRSDSRHQQHCAVFDSMEYYLDEELQMIWWQVFKQLGYNVALQEVQEWVEQQTEGPTPPAW